MVLKSLGPIFSLLAPVLISGIAATSLLAQENHSSSPAAISSPSSGQQTNSAKALQKSEGLRDLERSLFRPLREFEPEGSLDGVINSGPQRPAPVPNKRMKELIERRKNWVFMSPEEIVTGKSMQETLDFQGATKDDDQTKLLSPMERYFMKELQGNDKHKTKTAPGTRKGDPFFGSNKPFSVDDSEAQDESMSGLPDSAREVQRNLKKDAENASKKDGPFAHRSSPGFFSDVFALERGKLSSEEERAEKALLEKYKKSLGLDPTPTFGATFSPLFADPKDPYRISTPPSLMDSMSSLPQASAPAAPATTLPNSNPLLDSPSRSLTPSSLTPAQPKIDPPKSSLPPQPTFAAPRRAF